MKKIFKNLSLVFMIAVMLFTTACAKNNVESNTNDTATVSQNADNKANTNNTTQQKPLEDEYYYTKEDVAEYIHEYKKLPPNYITKKEAEQQGWSVKNTDGFVIGGDKFGNREGNLPDGEYFEADISAGYGNNRGAERLVFTKDGTVYYTDDHYETFEQLY